jgi:hypothetical protein
MRALRALPLLLAVIAPCAAAHDTLQAIDACVATLDAPVDVGYARIAARCPQLKPALTNSPWAPWLPADWTRPDNQLSAAGLTELRTLLARSPAAGQARRSAPRTAHLAAILTAVTQLDEGGGSWWLRLKDWLRRILQPQGAAYDSPLRRWLAQVKVSNTTMEVIAWSALAVVVALAAGIVFNELRVAGLFGAGESPRSRGHAPRRGSPNLTLEEIDSAAYEEQPALLLELITARLAEQGRLASARALTARELRERAHLEDESGRTRLAQLLTVCERLRFSAQPVDEAAVAAAVRGGRLLLATLGAPPLPASSARMP